MTLNKTTVASAVVGFLIAAALYDYAVEPLIEKVKEKITGFDGSVSGFESPSDY